jgi:membrane dipeptidase
MRTSAVAGACAAFLLMTACSGTKSEEEIVETARRIHESVITIDTHNDIPPNFASEEVNPGVRGDRQVDLPKMREGGLDAAFFVVYVGQRERTAEGYEAAKAAARTKFDAIHRMTDSMYPDQIELAYSPADVGRINGEGKLVACIGIENGYAIGRDIGLLEQYHELGASYLGLTHNGNNDICDSANPNPRLGDSEEDHGATEFGEQVIAEANRLGIMVDVSHASRQCMLDAVRLSAAPIIASHSSTRALRDVSRNLDDEQLLALKENGGVAQMVALGDFVKEDPPEKVAAMEALRQEMGLGEGYAGWRTMSDEQRAQFRAGMQEIQERWPVTVADFVDHIDHAVALIGIDHVGISSDFDGGGGIQGWNDASQALNVTVELVRRGYSEEEIRKLWGGNLLRVWREVERVAAEMQGVGTTG